MSDSDQHVSNKVRARMRRLPSPGCLFITAMIMIAASICFGLFWRTQRQLARLDSLRSRDAYVKTEPTNPVWLHDLVVRMLGEDHASGFTDITVVGLSDRQITDGDVECVAALSSLRELYLANTQITDDCLEQLSTLPCRIWTASRI